MIRLKHPTLSADDTEKAVRELLDDEQWHELEEHLDLDFCLETEDHGRYRANCFQQRKGKEAIFRLIPDTVPTLEDLNMPDVLKEFTQYNQGIVLVTGARRRFFA